MGQKRTKAEAPKDERERTAAALAATMPEDRAGLLDVAAQAVADMHAAIMAADETAAEAAGGRYEAAVWKLNGGQFFGCMDSSNPEAGGILAEDHCRAAPGTVPMWGQRGEFLITVSGIRAVVDVRDGYGLFRVSLGFHVVDVDAPFISETGFRSHFDTAQAGHTVEDVARAAFAAYLAKERRPLAPEYRQRRADDPARAWIEDRPEPSLAERAYAEADGQLAFGF
ncbi:MAG: hypothetical protein PHT60_15515 [Acidiphilium sp.]|nr:hypothetical protein [Acidiphilium sp.]MDD4937171.1 hypothetical protein [Acidiphilium sp.]